MKRDDDIMLNFSTDFYKNKAIDALSSNNNNSILNKEDAFIILIHGVSIDNLENLCILLSEKLNIDINSAYKLTQYPNNEVKSLLISLAYKVLDEKKHLGNKYTEDNKFNLSSWISHSLYEAKACERIAKILSIDTNFAFCYGLLHDYGRKFSHKFNHVIIGFENLIDLNLDDYAKGCLTHSFINGERYCNNEYIASGFNIVNGKVTLDQSHRCEDMYNVLLHSNYNIYDDILNIADLMATDSGIISPENRVKDIAKRRDNIDNSKNRCYFIASLHNLILKIIKLCGNDIDIKEISIDETNLEEVKEKFHVISDLFFQIYNNKITDKRINNEHTMQL